MGPSDVSSKVISKEKSETHVSDTEETDDWDDDEEDTQYVRQEPVDLDEVDVPRTFIIVVKFIVRRDLF